MYLQPSDPSWSLPAMSSHRLSASTAAALGVRLREAFPIRNDEDIFADLLNALSLIPDSRIRH